MRTAPSVVARFHHELPRVAASVSEWVNAPVGGVAPIHLELALDPEGRVDRVVDPLPAAREGAAEALRQSLKKTVITLFGRMSLPGHPVRAGRVRLRVGARVEDVAPQKLTIDGRPEVDPSFTLESGRRVTFQLEVTSVAPTE